MLDKNEKQVVSEKKEIEPLAYGTKVRIKARKDLTGKEVKTSEKLFITQVLGDGTYIVSLGEEKYKLIDSDLEVL